MSTTSVECYIDEYHDQRGALCARLREVGTDRKVRIVATSIAQRRRFLMFLSAAGSCFKRAGRSDLILVSGVVISSTSQIIDFAHDDQIRYLIK